MTASPPFMASDTLVVGCVAFDNMEIGTGDGLLARTERCVTVCPAASACLNQRNAGCASGAEDAQFHLVSSDRDHARGARERLIIGGFAPLILRLMPPSSGEGGPTRGATTHLARWAPIEHYTGRLDGPGAEA